MNECIVGGKLDAARVSAAAQEFNVSRTVVVLRLASLDRLSQNDAFQYVLQWTKPMPKRAGGGKAMPPAELCVTRKGTRFPRLVVEAFDQDRISLTEASTLLGLKIRWFDGLRRQLEA